MKNTQRKRERKRERRISTERYKKRMEERNREAKSIPLNGSTRAVSSLAGVVGEAYAVGSKARA